MLTKSGGNGFARSGARGLLRGRRAVLVIAATLASSACGKSSSSVAPPMPGSIVLSTETAGFLKDDSYELLVDGQSQGTIGANDEMTISGLDPAIHEVALGDVASNCDVSGASVEVGEDETVDVSLAVTCAFDQPASYTLRFNRSRPNLDDGTITECPFGICTTQDGWDLYVYYNSGTDPHSVIRQNQTTAVEIAHVTGVALADLTEQDYMAASFTTDLVADPFDAGRVILIRTDVGAVYALGNPVEDTYAQTLTLDAVLIVQP